MVSPDILEIFSVYLSIIYFLIYHSPTHSPIYPYRLSLCSLFMSFGLLFAAVQNSLDWPYIAKLSHEDERQVSEEGV